MSVRARLILAFLILSVLPLTAVTFYSYASSVRAFRAAVESESGRMALDLQQRLDTVTTDIGRQVGRLWERRGTAGPARGRSRGIAAGRPRRRAHRDDARATRRSCSSASSSRRRTAPRGTASRSRPPRRCPHRRRRPRRRAPPEPPPPRPTRRRDAARRAGRDRPAARSWRRSRRRPTAEGVPPEVAAQLEGARREARARVRGRASDGRLRHAVGASAMAQKARERAREHAARARAQAEADMAGRRVGRRARRAGRARRRARRQRQRAAEPARAPSRWCSAARRPRRARSRSRSTPTARSTPRAPSCERQLAALDVASMRHSGVRQQDDWVVVTREAPSDDHLRHREAGRAVAPGDPQGLGPQPLARPRRDRAGAHRHHPALAPHDAQPDDADRGRAADRAGRLHGARAGPLARRVRDARDRLQPDGAGRRAPPAARRRARAAAARARAVPADPDRDAAARAAPARARPR